MKHSKNVCIEGLECLYETTLAEYSIKWISYHSNVYISFSSIPLHFVKYALFNINAIVNMHVGYLWMCCFFLVNFLDIDFNMRIRLDRF